MLTKSQAAFLLSCRKLFDASLRVYFWTWTFVECYADHRYPLKLRYLTRRLTDTHFKGSIDGLCGLWVCEVHPGGHGLHYHVLVNRRIEMDALLEIGKPVGLGHCWVRLVEDEYIEQGILQTNGIERTCGYLAKYLTKSGDKLSRYMRRWSAFGEWEHVKKADIEIDSLFHRNLKEILNGMRADFSLVNMVRVFTLRFGPYKDWPKAALNTVTPCNEAMEGIKNGIAVWKPALYQQCPANNIGKAKLECIVFWSSSEMVKFAGQHGMVVEEKWLCETCGAMHCKMKRK